MDFLDGVAWIDVFYVFHAVLIVCTDFLVRPKDRHDSPEDTLRKTAVRTILHPTAVIDLAPTYNILSQFAIQFAGITGVSDEPYTTYHTPSQSSNLLSPSPIPTTFQGSVVEKSNQATEWYENESANAVPWDFLALYTSNENLGLRAYPDCYSGGLIGSEPSASEVDDWTARTLKGMHSI
ncbi:hypothetical protein BDV96DRAFT_691201 [Lophiotrema nucula]|uniref:Uncharacterized protein n=1 Tax=Lophiotrema nucula TaxID=690887 RepID=A0A6A5YTS2_9PLEO|nr:hypothetical protein BDV96DRAFT_691201 [Lophiotrema nucula]